MTWSLYEKNSEGGIFDYSGDLLKPLKFSNGKTQEDIVNDVLDLINKGNRIIFIHGVCGTGKSAIALNIAKNFKKSSIVVPIKSLQEQYEKDYTQKKFILKEDKTPLNISIIKGRNNFHCPYLGGKANEKNLPCTIEIRERNLDQLLDYIDKNPEVQKEDFSSISDIKRANVACACPYWSPIIPSELNIKGLKQTNKVKFQTISGKEFALFQRKKGCDYCDQYKHYATSDVLIFNSAKYLIELEMGRKPKTEIDIIDECDEFLDSFSNERKINLQRLLTSLTNLNPEKKEDKQSVRDLIYLINDFVLEHKREVDCEKVKTISFIKIIEKILENTHLASEEELNYYNRVVEILISFEKVLEETYISTEFIKKDEKQSSLFDNPYLKEDNIYVTLVSINLKQKMQELTSQNNVLILMSGTLHSEKVLKDIFGLDNFKIIKAETKNPGKIKVYRTGVERNCNYSNFKSGNITRERYLKMLDCVLANTKEKTLVHVNSFSDLPNEQEKERYKFDNLITQNDLREIQDNSNNAINDFLHGRNNILFTTKCSRGIDFPGDKCRNIILTRYPYPNIQSNFWKILKKEQPDYFTEFYMDKAYRELIQKISRGIRFEGDWINLLSPDIRVLNTKFF
ncbi:MAG: helicase C-terminal domain-containing protein [Candidatus Nanoarchaeia archaeon]|nr:helicase C-terminal domain-containing protein [Candidatus Nanoarchaeia archaeon]MDD4563691.1 helicase C-terminal domain-containing protein [Candidatus Nanoarchaeia archaeon]